MNIEANTKEITEKVTAKILELLSNRHPAFNPLADAAQAIETINKTPATTLTGTQIIADNSILLAAIGHFLAIQASFLEDALYKGQANGRDS